MGNKIMVLPLVAWLGLTILAVLNLLYAERPLLSPLAVVLMSGLFIVLAVTTILGFLEIKRSRRVGKK